MMARFTLFGAGLMMLVPGVLYLVAPQMMLDVPAIRLQSVNDHHLVRAAYGGGFLGMAALFLLGAVKAGHARTSLLAVAFLLPGFAVGRVYSIVVDGRPTPLFLGVLAAEICFALLAAASLRPEARAG